MKNVRYILVLCATLCCQSIFSIARDSINLRLAYDVPVSIYKDPYCKKGAVTIESSLDTDEFFYLTLYKKTLGKVYVRGASKHQIVYGWLELKKEQLYVVLKPTESVPIRLYSKPYAKDRYLVKEGNGKYDLYPVADVNIHTGWVSIRYEDGKCYWVSPDVQCPWYTECYGT